MTSAGTATRKRGCWPRTRWGPAPSQSSVAIVGEAARPTRARRSSACCPPHCFHPQRQPRAPSGALAARRCIGQPDGGSARRRWRSRSCRRGLTRSLHPRRPISRRAATFRTAAASEPGDSSPWWFTFCTCTPPWRRMTTPACFPSCLVPFAIEMLRFGAESRVPTCAPAHGARRTPRSCRFYHGGGDSGPVLSGLTGALPRLRVAAGPAQTVGGATTDCLEAARPSRVLPAPQSERGGLDKFVPSRRACPLTVPRATRSTQGPQTGHLKLLRARAFSRPTGAPIRPHLDCLSTFRSSSSALRAAEALGVPHTGCCRLPRKKREPHRAACPAPRARAGASRL